MRDGMSCGRAEELLSDHYEGSLEEPLLSELSDHLAACEKCRVLRQALGEVVEALRSHPVVEPAADLARRIADIALASPRPVARAVPLRLRLGRLAAVAPLPVAAMLAMGLSTALLLAGPRPDASGTARRLSERTVMAREYLLERKDRLVEDVRILRVVIATAFEGRLDRVSDRVDDYRRLLERRKDDAKQPGLRGSTISSSTVLATSFRNFADARLVDEGVPARSRS
jgi:hypothetical protein